MGSHDPVCSECGASVLAAGLCRACANHREVIEVRAENRRLRRELEELADFARAHELSVHDLVDGMLRIAKSGAGTEKG
ncbi:hypothetical protein [Labilithrix luteola]|uniref:hypothetical protein n=1 Tax=Labilithrix luteola TaxID=1391654 RepID=UPI0011BA8570|nr:hypothetical protein [Labilithrix luteola]